MNTSTWVKITREEYAKELVGLHTIANYDDPYGIMSLSRGLPSRFKISGTIDGSPLLMLEMVKPRRQSEWIYTYHRIKV